MSEFAKRQGWDTEEVASCFQVTEEGYFCIQARDKGLEAALGCALKACKAGYRPANGGVKG